MATINTEAEKRAYQKFIAAGMTPAGACGLIGNLEAESDGFYTSRVEYLCIKRLKENGKEYTDETYTAAIDSGTLSCEDFLHPLPGKQYGYGLAQWTSPGRKSGLWSAAKEQGVSIADEDMQLEYLLQELATNYSGVLQVLKTATSIRAASDAVLKKFEEPADTSETVCASRAARGQKFYDEYVAAEAAEEETTVSTWEKTKTLLDDQVGYMEKKSASDLDSKTGNAGYANYTKYARDVSAMGLMGCQGQPWCAVYQFWVCAKIFGKAKALEIMGNGFYNCNSIKSYAKAKGTWHSTPKLGALVIFRNGAHVDRVIRVTDTMIYTNEGNTSSGKSNTVEANGGCVAEKSYTIGNSQIDGYVWIDYGTETSEQDQTSTSWKATGTATSTVDNLYVRADPNGEIIGELMQGNRFEVNGVTSGKWTQVNVANIGVGWVWTAYVQHDGQTNTNTTINNRQDQTERLFVGKVKATSLNVRTWAGIEYPQIKSYPCLANSNLVDVMNYTQTASDGSKWYFVRIADKYHGFVCADYIDKV